MLVTKKRECVLILAKPFVPMATFNLIRCFVGMVNIEVTANSVSPLTRYIPGRDCEFDEMYYVESFELQCFKR